MAYLASELIAKSYYLSGIVARDFETVGGSQQADGLDLLNSFLAIKSANNRYIPYYTEYDFTGVIGQEKYFIPGLISVETFTFFINDVRYQTSGQGRDRYFGSARANNIKSLPLSWHYERILKGSNFYVYFFPDQNYPMTIWGKFNLSSVTLMQDLSLTLDDFYIEYLRYGLAEYMCSENGVSFQPQSYQKLQEYEKYIMDISPPDLTLQTMGAFGPGAGLMYADANIGKGYRP
jgi:hypothetical protein